MKALLVCEQQNGKLMESTCELLAFAKRRGAEAAMLLIGSEANAPSFNGRLYLVETGKDAGYDPDLHKSLVVEAVRRENADLVVFPHSSYGWDLAPRVAAVLRAAQLSEVVDLAENGFILPCYNAKLRRKVIPRTTRVVVTIQAGAFGCSEISPGTPQVERLELAGDAHRYEFVGYEVVEKTGMDLSKAEVIVSAGRGVGKKENLPMIAALAKALGGEIGATRPVVDAGWLDHSHQVGTTGQIVHPKLYLACGISGAIQHLAGMKQSDFIVAVNKDREAPIGSVADVLVVADVVNFVPVLTARLEKA